MKRLKLLGLVIVAVFASAAAMSASAFALETPENLPVLEAGKTRTYTGVGVGTTEFRAEGQSPVRCPKSKGTGTETKSKAPEGEFKIDFEECEAEIGGFKVKCTGLGEASGVILTSGTWVLVFDREKGKEFTGLTTGLLFKNVPTHFSCSIVLITVLAGETLCLHKNPTTKSLKHEFQCFGEAAPGVKPVEEYSLTDTGPFKTPDLKTSVNEAATEVPSIQLGVGVNTGTVETFADQ